MFKQYIEWIFAYVDEAFSKRKQIDPVDMVLVSPSGDFFEVEETMQSDNLLRLLRRYDGARGTLGTLIFPNGDSIVTLELPWLNNRNDVSCIPEGLYEINYRESPIVERTSKGKYKKGYEIAGVPNRTFIMFHIGNFLRNSNGCVLTGTTVGMNDADGNRTITQSAVAFDKFMKLMGQFNITHISIEEENNEAA